jgi:hypothetical protein
MTREQYIRAETSRFVLEEYYYADRNDKPFNMEVFLASCQVAVVGLDEELRRHIEGLPPEEIEQAEREALFTTHVHQVVELCHKIDKLEKISEQALKLTTKPGGASDMCLMLRMFGLVGAIRGELQAMEKRILY